jgi:hypothetical protein
MDFKELTEMLEKNKKIELEDVDITAERLELTG